MHIFGRITVRDGSWPSRCKIHVLLREESYNGKAISADVRIVARKNNNPATEQKLGLNNTDLTVRVENGRWASPEWDYKYWADQGFNTLVFIYNDQEWFWSSVPLPKKEKKVTPTSISPIQYVTKQDPGDPEVLHYQLFWSIFDQTGAPIDGKVSVLFAGENTEIQSDQNLKGRCFDAVSIIGFGATEDYLVFPPAGDPKILKLTGPKKPAQPSVPTPVKLTEPIVVGSVDPNQPDTMIYSISAYALDEQGKVCPDVDVVTASNGAITTLASQATLGGMIVDKVEVKGFGNKLEYILSLPGVPTEHGSKKLLLNGPPEKPAPVRKDPELQVVLEVKIPRAPNANNSFTVIITSKAGDKPKGNVKFTLSCIHMLVVTSPDGSMLGQGNSVDLVTDQNGSLTFTFDFDNPVQAHVSFGLPGFSTTKLFVKMPY